MPNGSRVLPLSMRYAYLAFHTLSLLDLVSSSGISKKVFSDCGGLHPLEILDGF